MKKLYVITMTAFLSIFLVVTVNAATTGKKDAQARKKSAMEVSTSGVTEKPKGLTNLQKVMMHKIERSKKMHQKIEGPSGK